MRRIMKVGNKVLVGPVLCCMGRHLAQAQNLSAGIKGGFIISNDMKGVPGGGSKSKLYTFGPTLEANLPFKKLSMEVSFLYRRVGYKSSFEAFGTHIDQVRGNLFEVPWLLKFNPVETGSKVQPFISVGPVLRILANAKKKAMFIGIDYVTGEQIISTYESNLDSRGNPFGLSVGAGIRPKSGRIRFSPEIRYTRWSGPLFDEAGAHGFSVKSSTDKLEFVLNLSFVP